ncbi:MAG TPA: hypothetical protein VI548_11555 [Chitinophagaceae bacterium]|nr:hypothetical protein [Chitinophagaceae bacterium]
MEVHHHTHTPGKKWTHYFWEFLMLFLAVFCGFLAENQREHYIEHQREKQYIIALINDLEFDTAALSNNLTWKVRKLKNIDSSLYPLIMLEKDEIPLRICWKLFGGIDDIYFFSNNGTITQLKNSGGLRLISKRNIVDSIEAYDWQIKRLGLRQEDWRSYHFIIREIPGRFISMKNLLRESQDSTYSPRPGANPESKIPINKSYQDELIIQYRFLRGLTYYDERIISQASKKAENLIKILKKEYHLK